MNSRLAIGTVQFGMPYGVANKNGQTNRDEAAAILKTARAAGVDTLDTAADYGESEQRLGEIGIAGWQVISKLPTVGDDRAGWVKESCLRSLEKLRICKLRGLLVHRSEQLSDELWQALMNLKTDGLVEKVGVSVCGPDELDLLWPRFRFDLVQAPFNVVDRRLASSGWLDRLHQSGVEVHVRSAFLQGLLLMENRPQKFNRWQPLWERWSRWLDETGVGPLEACLGFVLSHHQVDRLVLGVDTLEHLQSILAAAGTPPVTVPDALASNDLDLINPSRWSTL